MIVFCTTCKGRAPHIMKTLPQNLADNPNSKFVVLDYNSQDGLINYLRNAHRVDIAAERLVVYSYLDTTVFKMAHAKNMVHRLGIMEGADILVNLDADNFTGPNFEGFLEERFKESNIFMWSKVVPGEGLRGCCGRIAITSDTFLCAGGYDEKYDTYGPDDKDFTARLTHLGIQERRIEKCFLSTVPHSNKLRYREYPHLMKQESCYLNENIAIDASATIANFGNFGCGRVYKNFSGESIDLKPLPTRIFGIGMHKTATTSLNQALAILGFKSGHWVNAHWAIRIYAEMKSEGRSKTLEQYYALSDLPMPLVFKELDKAYPGSKFILTLRDEKSWLKSVRKHWDPVFNKFRNQWKTDPATNRLHKALYGQKNFDAEIFLARFRQHNAEVQEYFKDRPSDLLVLNMSEVSGWPELCKFLNKQIPEIDYPKAYVSK